MIAAARLYRFAMVLHKSGARFARFCSETSRLPGDDCPGLRFSSVAVPKGFEADDLEPAVFSATG